VPSNVFYMIQFNYVIAFPKSEYVVMWASKMPYVLYSALTYIRKGSPDYGYVTKIEFTSDWSDVTYFILKIRSRITDVGFFD